MPGNSAPKASPCKLSPHCSTCTGRRSTGYSPNRTHSPSLAYRVHPSLPTVEHVRERGWMRGVHFFVRRHQGFGDRWHHAYHRVHSLANPCLPHTLMSTHGGNHGDMIFAPGDTVCRLWHPCYTGVNAIRWMVRSTEATLL